MLKDDEIQRIAERVTRERRGEDVEAVEVRSTADHDGDPIVIVSLRYRDGATADPHSHADMRFAIRDELLARGDERFVHLWQFFVDDAEPPPRKAAGKGRGP